MRRYQPSARAARSPPCWARIWCSIRTRASARSCCGSRWPSRRGYSWAAGSCTSSSKATTRWCTGTAAAAASLSSPTSADSFSVIWWRECWSVPTELRHSRPDRARAANGGPMTPKIVPGRPDALGATSDARGTNFAVASGGDEVRLCLFDADGAETQLVLPDRDGDVWHGFVPGVGPGQAYGFRVSGPFDPGRGLRYNPAKLLLDPYARAIAGDVRFGPEVLGHSVENASAPSPLDSAGHVPRSLVSPLMPPIAVAKPRPPLADTILYEVHVRGFTATHPGVPQELRGTYAGLAHEAALRHLVDVGVTAVELLPVHRSVPEQFLVDRGLTNYWGYNTIGFFAPHANYSAAARAGQSCGEIAEFRAMVDALHTAGLGGDPKR